MPTLSDQRSQTSPFWIKVDGSDLSPAELGQVVDLTIEQDLVLPDTFAIRLRDKDDHPGQLEQVYCKLLDADRFPVGSTIEIGLGREESPQRALKGEITSLDLDARADHAPMITVRGYDGAHRLHRERKSRTFVNATDQDIVSRIAREYGLTPDAEAAGGVSEHVFQDNQSDWEFLRSRANRLGFELFVVDRKLVFRKPKDGGPLHEVEFARSLHRLRLRLSAPSQVDEVVVKGWDPRTKREIVGRATHPSARARIGERRTGAEVASRLGSGRFVLAQQPLNTQGEAETLAQAVYDEIAGDFIQLEGVCLGDPQLRPGQPIRIKGVGRRFDGTYHLSAATHKLTHDEGYVVHFTVSGRRPATLSALLSGHGHGAAGAHGKSNGRSAGVAVATVTNIKDPDYGGRVKVQFAGLSDEESTWARLASPMAGAGRGFYFLPEVGDEVLVAFEQGDINHPYVVGVLWNGRDKPPKSAGDVVGPTGLVNQRIIRSRSGHTITLDDSDDRPGIAIVDKSGNSITLDTQSNALTIKVQGNTAVEAQGDVTFKGKNIRLEATNDLQLKGLTTAMEATSKAELKAATAEVQSTGPLTLKGATVSIN